MRTYSSICITPAQLRIALALSNISADAVLVVISQLPEPIKTVATIRWEYALQFQRNDETLIQVAAALGLSSEQFDALWEQAITY